MAVVVEVSDDGNANAQLLEAFVDVRNRFRGIIVVNGDADDFAASASQRGDLLDRSGNVGGVGVGHGLHHDWCSAADADFSSTIVADDGGERFSAKNLCHKETFILAVGVCSQFLAASFRLSVLGS